jgi:excisionase family DNA binding protein
MKNTLNKNNKKQIIKGDKRMELYDPKKAESIRLNPPIYMSISEAACYIGVSPRTVREYIKRGVLPVARLGLLKKGRIIIRRFNIDDLLAESVKSNRKEIEK